MRQLSPISDGPPGKKEQMCVLLQKEKQRRSREQTEVAREAEL